MYGVDVNTLNVYVTSAGQTYTNGQKVWTRSFNQGNQWKQAQVTISPTSAYQVIF